MTTIEDEGIVNTHASTIFAGRQQSQKVSLLEGRQVINWAYKVGIFIKKKLFRHMGTTVDKKEE